MGIPSYNVRRAARDAKKLFFSIICVFYSREERDLLILLSRPRNYRFGQMPLFLPGLLAPIIKTQTSVRIKMQLGSGSIFGCSIRTAGALQG